MSAYQTFRNTVVVVLTLAGIYVAYLSSHILIVLLIAIITASALRPAVVRLNKWHAPMGLAILLAYLGLGLGIFGLAVVVVPPVTSQLAQYMNNDQSLANQIISAQSWVEQTIQSYTGNPIKFFDPADIRKTVSMTIEQVIVAFPAIAGTFGVLAGDLVLVIVIGVYWLTKRDRTIDFVLQLIPLGQRASAGEIVREIEHAMGSYLRGIVLVACFVGTANFLILSLLRVPNAVTLGFIVGVTTVVPIVGGYIGAGTATFLALLSSPLNALFALATFVGVQQIENHYLTPRVLSRSVGLNPILIIVFLFVGFALGGVVGAVLAIPIAGAAATLLRYMVIVPRLEENTPQVIDGGILIASKNTEQPDLQNQPST